MKMLLGLLIVMQSLGTPFSSMNAQSSSSSATQQTAAAEHSRKVKGQVLTSTAMPALRLEFNKEFKYIGNQDFILYDVTRAGQHFFVDADKPGRTKRLYWVEFEGYLPSKTRTHR